MELGRLGGCARICVVAFFSYTSHASSHASEASISAASPLFIVPSDSSGSAPFDSTLSRTAPIRVQADRPSRQDLLDRNAGFGSVVQSSSWANGLETAASILSRDVGVTVRETGGLGGYSVASIRGSTPAQVPVYLDGVPMASLESGAANLADVPLDTVERIEVYRGAAPLVLGGASLGGAIHLVSREGATRPWMRGAAGSYGTYVFDGGAGTTQATWSAQVRGRWLQSRGDWEFPFDNRTPYNPADDTEALRVNNDIRGGGGLAVVRARMGAISAKLSEILDGREQGIPGRDLQSGSARGTTFTHQIRATVAPASGIGILRQFELFHRLDRQGFDDPLGELGLGRTVRTDRTHAVGATLIGALSGRGRDAWRLEAYRGQLRSEIEQPVPETGAPQTRWTGAVALQPVLRLWNDRLLVQPGARLELHHDRFHGTPPFGNYGLPGGPQATATTWAHTLQLGLVQSLPWNCALKANIGRSDRVPTLLERFGHRGTVIGNPDLVSESGLNRDVGLVWNAPRGEARAEISVFSNRSEDLIVFVRNSQLTSRPLNVGQAAIRGIELDLKPGRVGFLRPALRYTGLHTEDQSDEVAFRGQPLPGRPGYELEARLDLVGPGFELGYEFVALGDNTLERHGRTEIPSRALHGVHASYARGWWTADLRLENAGDADALFDLYGWPLPGRQLMISLRTGGSRVP